MRASWFALNHTAQLKMLLDRPCDAKLDWDTAVVNACSRSAHFSGYSFVLVWTVNEREQEPGLWKWSRA